MLAFFMLACVSLSARELTLSVASHAAQACETRIAASAVQQDMEAQLRDAGFQVAKAHTASLASEIDCVPVTESGKNTGIAVHQCLALSQVVSLPTQARNTMATTWRQCLAYTCALKGCESTALSGVHQLVTAFIGEVPQLTEARPAAPAPSPVRSAFDSGATVLYMSFYILACFAVLFRWEWSKHALKTHRM